MRPRLTITLICLLTGSLVALIGANGAAAAEPVIYNGVLGYSHASRTASPPGANDWSCRPSARHPRPVVLVHGTFADMSDSWQALSPLLRNHGYCVFALNYGASDGSDAFGIYATGDIAQSAAQLSDFVDRVLAATGADAVDLVGHSQGGMMPRYYLKTPRRRRPGAHPGRAGALQPRHHRRRPLHARLLLPGGGRLLRRLPGLRTAGGRLAVPDRAQRRRRDGAGSPLHRDRVRIRRGRHALHLGVPQRPRA